MWSACLDQYQYAVGTTIWFCVVGIGVFCIGAGRYPAGDLCCFLRDPVYDVTNHLQQIKRHRRETAVPFWIEKTILYGA